MKKNLTKFFDSVCIIGILLVSTELILDFFGTKLCETEGCELVAKQVRYGDWIILLLGLLIFLAIFITHRVAVNYKKRNLEYKSDFYNQLNSFILIVALACEGFFTGFQAFRLYLPCYFCLIVFSLILILSILKLFMGSKEMLSGFGAFFGVFILFYLVLPVNKEPKLPEENLVIFYSENCKHCKELLKELDEKKIIIPHYLVDESPDLLKSVGIYQVPVMFINQPTEKRFIVGKSNILKFLMPEKKDTSQRKVYKKRAEKSKSILDLTPKNTLFNVPDDSCDERKENCD